MERPAIPPDEPARLAELRSLSLLDTDPEERFDRVTRVAQRLFGVPVALVSLVDADRQWFKSRQGLAVTETPRDVSFCGHAVLDDSILSVPDASVDPRFFDNPLVLADPQIRFYAGCPISGPAGAKLGTLCIIDRTSRALAPEDAASLRDLAELVEREIEGLYLATADALTGLYNRRGFDLLAGKALKLCRRQFTDASLLYFDLNGFKAINDRFGHPEGDRALQEFGRLIAGACRSSDIVARLGGDEFAALMPGDNSLPEVLVRIGAALDEWNAAPGQPYDLSASIGFAHFQKLGTDSIEEMLRLGRCADVRPEAPDHPRLSHAASGHARPGGVVASVALRHPTASTNPEAVQDSLLAG